jgi:hypothetical protein
MNRISFRHHRRTIGGRRGRKSTDHRTYMDAARFGRCFLPDGIKVRLQSYIWAASEELGSAWP